jgi:hypothetical protein
MYTKCTTLQNGDLVSCIAYTYLYYELYILLILEVLNNEINILVEWSKLSKMTLNLLHSHTVVISSCVQLYSFSLPTIYILMRYKVTPSRPLPWGNGVTMQMNILPMKNLI